MMIRTTATAAFLFLASAGQAAAKMAIPASLRGQVVQVQEAIAVSDKASDAWHMLGEEQCAPLNKEIDDYYYELLADYTDEEIIEWSCNDLQRKKSMEKVKAKEADLGTQTDPCVEALEELVEEADSEGIADAKLGDKAACSEDVGKLLAVLRNRLDSPQFVEAGFFSFVILAGAVAAGGAAPTALLVTVLIPVVPPPP